MTKEELTIIKKKNHYLRYSLIKELYKKAEREHPHTPLTKILEFYILPVYPISRVTLYEILCTPVTNKLKEIAEIENKYK